MPICLSLKDKVFDILKQNITFHNVLKSCSDDLNSQIYDLAMCAEFKPSIYKDDFEYTVVINIYKTIFGYAKSNDVRYIKYKKEQINVNNDWMNKNKLWFRKCGSNQFESLFEYNNQYRDVFVLKSQLPLVTFNVNI